MLPTGRAVSSISLALLIIAIILAAGIAASITLTRFFNPTTPSTTSSNSPTTSSASSSLSTTSSSLAASETTSGTSVQSVTSSSSLSSTNSSPASHLIVQFRGAKSFIYDQAHKLVFALSSTNNAISEINATTNSVLNTSYFKGSSQMMITGAFADSGTLYVNEVNSSAVGTPPDPNRLTLYPQTTFVIQNGTIVKIISRGYSGLLFATAKALYFSNPKAAVFNFQNPVASTITVLDKSFNFVANLSEPRCTDTCRFTGAFYDPVNGYAYVTTYSVGVDGGHGFSMDVLNTATNSIVPINASVNNPASFTLNPSNGEVYMSSAWDESRLGYCQALVVPGANITVFAGANISSEIVVTPNSAPTIYGGSTTNSSGYPTCLGGFPPSESGENDTLGSIAFNSSSESIYVANGTVQNRFGSNPVLSTITAISSVDNVSVIASYRGGTITALFYDPADGDLYVSEG